MIFDNTFSSLRRASLVYDTSGVKLVKSESSQSLQFGHDRLFIRRLKVASSWLECDFTDSVLESQKDHERRVKINFSGLIVLYAPSILTLLYNATYSKDLQRCYARILFSSH